MIGPDQFEVQFISTGNNGSGEEVADSLLYNYTNSGYMPLHPHLNEKGKQDLPVQRVVYLWTVIVRERLQAMFPDCRFGDVVVHPNNNNLCLIPYNVAPLMWKRWF